MIDLFDMTAVAPAEVTRVAAKAASGVLDLRGLTPCAQLAVFSELRERGTVSEERLDELMTAWLRRLGARRNSFN